MDRPHLLSSEPSAKSHIARRAPFWPLLLIVNGGWIAFLIGTETVLPDWFGDNRGWPRAVIRVSLLLIPSLVYLSRYDQGHWADRMGLIANWRRGLVVGASVSLLWFIPQFIGRSTDAVFDATDLTAGIWLNAIFGSPFAEELLYRQIVLRNLSERFPLWMAVAASAFWFTLLHVPATIMTTTPVEVAEYLCVIFAYGVVFSLLYAFSKSLWGPLLPHILNNLFFAVVSGE